MSEFRNSSNNIGPRRCLCGRPAIMTLDTRQRDCIPAFDTIRRDAVSVCEDGACQGNAAALVRFARSYVVAARPCVGV